VADACYPSAPLRSGIRQATGSGSGVLPAYLATGDAAFGNLFASSTSETISNPVAYDASGCVWHERAGERIGWHGRRGAQGPDGGLPRAGFVGRLTFENNGGDSRLDTMGPQNPQALNRYSYVLNNPLRWKDANGHAVPDPNEGGGKSSPVETTKKPKERGFYKS